MTTPKLVHYAMATARSLVSQGGELPPSLFYRDGHEHEFMLRQVSLEATEDTQEMPRLIADAVAEGVQAIEFALILVGNDQAKIIYQRTFGSPPRVWRASVHRRGASPWMGDFDEAGGE